MEGSIRRNYHLIFHNIITYLPSRILIILNSVIIIPFFTYLLCEKQMSIYLIAIQILNLMCTCSFDWITKAVLRFYEKYNLKNALGTFFSTIFWISVIVYLILIIGYFLFKEILLNKFSIDNVSLLLVLLIAIPCGIRQFLYQILRIKNKVKLYTFSILLYQLTFILMFFLLVKIIPNAGAILFAMLTAVVFIDVYIIRLIYLNYKIECKINPKITAEILKYALPLIITNTCYWGVLNFGKFIFQNTHQYLNTSITGVSWMLSENIMQPLVTVFTFASFPVLIKKFELKRKFKPYFTNIIQLYCFLLLPVLSVFCYFSKEIVHIILPENYKMAACMLPFFAFGIFLHELMKLINIKYHLKNKTYIEMGLSILITVMAFLFTVKMINLYSLLGAALALFLSEVTLIGVNLFVKFKSFDYINYRKIFKTFFISVFIGIILLGVIRVIFTIFPSAKYIYTLKIIIFILLYYLLSYKFREKLLS